MKLTPKQKAFADYYIQYGNCTKAAIKAGYSERSASEIGAENLRKPQLRLYIDEAMKQKENERIASADEVLEFLTSVTRGKIIEEVPVVHGKDFTIVNKKPSVRDRNRAAELLAKRYGLLNEKIQVEAKVENIDYIAEWTDDETKD